MARPFAVGHDRQNLWLGESIVIGYTWGRLPVSSCEFRVSSDSNGRGTGRKQHDG